MLAVSCNQFSHFRQKKSGYKRLFHNSILLSRMQSAFPPGKTSDLETSALVVNTNQCWGAQLQLNCGAGCTPGFLPGKLHFKSKFCDHCRGSIMVPLDRVRALSAELAACFVNKRSEGFWNSAPKSMGGGQYRILNNTAGSIGPWIALFRDQPPNFNWHAASRFKLLSPSLSLIVTSTLTRRQAFTKQNHLDPKPEPSTSSEPLPTPHPSSQSQT
jgi:hypothetical protein